MFTAEQYKQALEEIRKEVPGFIPAFLFRDGRYVIGEGLPVGFTTLNMLPSCCGVYDLQNWRNFNPTNEEKRNFNVLCYMAREGTFGIKTGALITTTNENYEGLNKLLKEVGFVPITFFNENSYHHVTLWTLILHPKNK